MNELPERHDAESFDIYLQEKHEEAIKLRTQELALQSEMTDELKFISRASLDVIKVLSLCVDYGQRMADISNRSLVIRSTDDLVQSVISVWTLVEQGLINPVKRELRYVIESSIKYLYVDQQTRNIADSPTLHERIEFLDANVKPSIDIRKQLELDAFHADDAKKFVDELYDIYRDCCAYVHVSRRQIEERLKLAEQGRSLVFKSDKDLKKIGRLIFRVYDAALALYFHGYGLSMAGDIFVEFFDDIPQWKFHKGKYVNTFSAYFDYKHERNIRKYGESRSWSPEGWPPKRL